MAEKDLGQARDVRLRNRFLAGVIPSEIHVHEDAEALALELFQLVLDLTGSDRVLGPILEGAIAPKNAGAFAQGTALANESEQDKLIPSGVADRPVDGLHDIVMG